MGVKWGGGGEAVLTAPDAGVDESRTAVVPSPSVTVWGGLAGSNTRVNPAPRSSAGPNRSIPAAGWLSAASHAIASSTPTSHMSDQAIEHQNAVRFYSPTDE